MATVNVFTETKTLELIGKTIVKAEVVGDNLILTTQDGTVLPAVRVRSATATNPTATQTSFTPAAGIAAATLQAALAEVAGDISALNTSKINKTAMPLIRRGTVTMPSGTGEKTGDFSTIFPSGYFPTAPDVVPTVVMPDQPSPAPAGTPNPTHLIYYSMYTVTTTGFFIKSSSRTSPALKFNYLAIG